MSEPAKATWSLNINTVPEDYPVAYYATLAPLVLLALYWGIRSMALESDQEARMLLGLQTCVVLLLTWLWPTCLVIVVLLAGPASFVFGIATLLRRYLTRA